MNKRIAFTCNHHIALHTQLQESFLVNSFLADHYRQLFFSCTRGWRFTRAAFRFIKWQAYERKVADISKRLKYAHKGLQAMWSNGSSLGS